MDNKIKEKLIEKLNTIAEPITQEKNKYDSLLEKIGNARYVLIGEASHGTQEFYQARIEISQRLITEKGFMAIGIEGGYFNRTYQSPLSIEMYGTNLRPLMSSIYYLLTDDRPIGHFHLNKSDILHFFQLGSPITYLTISPEGKLEKFKVGTDLVNGQTLQLLVKGGYWKASVLEEGEMGLISEAVSPGFSYEDMVIGTANNMKILFPYLWPQICAYVKS